MYLKIYDKKKKEILSGGLNVTSEGIISSENVNSEDILVIRGVKSPTSDNIIFAGDILKFDLSKLNIPKEHAELILTRALKFARLPENFDSIIVEIQPRRNSMDISLFKFSLNGQLIKEDDFEEDFDYVIPTDVLESVLIVEHYLGTSEKIGEIDWSELCFLDEN